MDSIYAEKIVQKYYTDAKYIGSGSYGCAFYINNNKVVKVTTDETEFTFANNLVGKKKKEFVYVYKVFKHTEEKTYFILETELLNLNHSYLNSFDKQFFTLFRTSFRAFVWKYQQNTDNIKDITEHNQYSKLKNKRLFNQLLLIAKQIKSLNYVCHDIRPDNIGFRKNKPVLLDLGRMYERNNRFLNYVDK